MTNAPLSRDTARRDLMTEGALPASAMLRTQMSMLHQSVAQAMRDGARAMSEYRKAGTSLDAPADAVWVS